MNSTANIHKRFNLLFTLPSTPTTAALLIAFSSPIILLTSLIIQVDLSSMPIYLLTFEVAVFLSVISERIILSSNSLAIFRRLAFLSVISTGIWLTLVTLGFLMSPERLLSFIILGAFFSFTFRLLVFGSVFFRHLYTALLVAAIQPVLLTLLLAIDYNLPVFVVQNPVLFGSGFTLIGAVLLYLQLINSSGSGILKAPVLTMFQAFLQAWSSEEPSSLEDIIEKSSSETTVKTSIITFHTDKMKPMLIVPEVHPGPFYPIGSSNLPFQIFRYFSDRGFSPLVLHGVSGHELNLTSKKEVDNLLSSYKHLKSLREGDTCTRPVTAKSGKAVANGLAFGDCVVIFLTLSPHGMEDFPREIKKPLEEASLKNGFKHLLLVDTHNSQGNQLEQEESVELIDVTNKIFKKLKKAKHHPFKIGFAHSSELNITFAWDIGPAGIGVWVLEIDEDRYTLVAVDANNACRGLREEVIDHLDASKISVLELCTSDTHITAGKVMTMRGYVALGDETQTEYLVSVIKNLYEKAVENLSKSSFDVKYVDTDVKVVGGDLLDDISQALDKVISTARRGGFFLVALSLIALLITLMF